MHDVTQTNLKKLDSLCDRFCKKWLSMPRSATPAILHLSSGLNIKSISQLYKECHSINHVSSRLKADSNVNAALTSKIERESAWARKDSITVYSENLFKESAKDIGDTSPCTQKQLSQVKTKVKKVISDEFNSYWCEHVKGLAVQGSFLGLLNLEKKLPNMAFYFI